MTFDEIFRNVKKEKINIFEAYTLLSERQDEVSKERLKTIKTCDSETLRAYEESEICKNLEAEIQKCSELMEAIIKLNFDCFTDKNHSAEYLYDVPRCIFELSKAKNDKQQDIFVYKEAAKKTIDSRISFLSSLKSLIDKE